MYQIAIDPDRYNKTRKTNYRNNCTNRQGPTKEHKETRRVGWGGGRGCTSYIYMCNIYIYTYVYVYMHVPTFMKSKNVISNAFTLISLTG